ncbi:TPA: hypothetical protein MFD13_002382 [Klebsiella pneumoniae]|nr:hypothetical protein [Klebsiella pneumoniae]HBV2215668.1 hypothetical protein [Klebsiella quasipneumoniae]HBW1942541.1 hypothetical protein [Klebsiella pneumoniae]HBW7302247.1 hypothetical protein [Klebsiella pneumoniae]HBW7351758.1 hypothetical protein [Klebsiella pneumoniae]
MPVRTAVIAPHLVTHLTPLKSCSAALRLGLLRSARNVSVPRQPVLWVGSDAGASPFPASIRRNASWEYIT